MKALHTVTFILLIVGGLNWLLVGLFGHDLFQMLHMEMSGVLPKIVYILVGLSAVVEVSTHKKLCKACESKPAQTPAV